MQRGFRKTNVGAKNNGKEEVKSHKNTEKKENKHQNKQQTLLIS